MTPAVDEVRRDVRQWIADHWNPHASLREWRELLVGSGWAVPSWPRRWFGLDLPGWADRVVADELAAAGAVGLPLGGGVSLAAPTLLRHASDGLNDSLLRRTLVGDLTWCQLFSEPGAGSDLASLSAFATLDGDEWVVNGQKVWTTSAHHADLGMLLVRTDRAAAKHHGITYLVLPMRQEGVEVRPIVQMNRHSSFNEVFLTDARVPARHVVGEVGGGWNVARTTLAHERSFATMRRPRSLSTGRLAGRAVREAEAEAQALFATYAWYPQRAGRPDLLTSRLGRAGLSADAATRDQVVGVLALQRANEWTAARARVALALGRPPGAEGSIGKLAASEVARRSAAAHTRVAGASGMLSGETSADPDAAVVAEVLVSTPAQSIAGGTDEIQRNIVGEKILGLPREPQP